MFDGADTVVLYEELAFQDVLPVLWRPSPGPLDPDTAAGLADRNVQVLQAWDAMETSNRPTPPRDVRLS